MRNMPKASGGRKRRFINVDKRLRRELKKERGNLGTLSDIATVGGGGEPLGETIAPKEKPTRSRRRQGG